MNLLLTPAQRIVPIEEKGTFERIWWMFFDSITTSVNYLLGLPVSLMEQSTQAGLSALADTLTASNAGLLVEVTDYRHTLRWTGAGWQWGPGEDGNHGPFGLLLDPDNTTGWHLCDGSTVSYLNGDGTLTTGYVLPDWTSAANKAVYTKLGTPVSSANAATAPTLIMNSYTPAGTNSAPIFTGTPGTTSAASAGAQGSGATGNTLTQATHTHTLTPAGTVSAPTFTGTPATLTGTISATGEPRNAVLRPWFRL